MECLEHICTEGCTDVGPYHVEVNREKKPCSQFSTCQGLQLLIRHFATCKRRVKGGCLRCKRMWQLFRLHSYICQQTEGSCNVPLCRSVFLNSAAPMQYELLPAYFVHIQLFLIERHDLIIWNFSFINIRNRIVNQTRIINWIFNWGCWYRRGDSGQRIHGIILPHRMRSECAKNTANGSQWLWTGRLVGEWVKMMDWGHSWR